MDHEQRTIAAQQQDPELAARIVRNIEQLERDSHYAAGPLSERLMRDIGAAIQNAAPEPWIVAGNDTGVTLTLPDWKANRGVNHNDAWIELSDLTLDEQEYSWISVIVNAGPTKLGLELKVRPGLAALMETVPAKDKAITNLVKAGFEYEQVIRRLAIPVAIDAETLAKGLEFNDLDAALAPVRTAVEVAIAAKPDLNALIDHLRTEAKKK